MRSNKMQDQISRHCIFKAEMKGQNLKKRYKENDFNLMCKTNKRTTNFIISFLHDKMSHGT